MSLDGFPEGGCRRLIKLACADSLLGDITCAAARSGRWAGALLHPRMPFYRCSQHTDKITQSGDLDALRNPSSTLKHGNTGPVCLGSYQDLSPKEMLSGSCREAHFCTLCPVESRSAHSPAAPLLGRPTCAQACPCPWACRRASSSNYRSPVGYCRGLLCLPTT